MTETEQKMVAGLRKFIRCLQVENNGLRKDLMATDQLLRDVQWQDNPVHDLHVSDILEDVICDCD
jgi:hypothetical protein